jgi:hypothetical protein
MALFRWFKFLLKWIGTKQTRMDKKSGSWHFNVSISFKSGDMKL